MNEICIKKSYLQAAYLFISKEKEENLLEHVFFDKSILFASDRRVLCSIYCEGEYDTIPGFAFPGQIQQLIKQLSKKDVNLYFELDFEKSTIYFKNLDVMLPLPKVNVPKFISLFPKIYPHDTIYQYNPELLMLFLKASKLLNGAIPVIIHGTPAKVDIGLDNFMGLIMPLSHNISINTENKDFIKRLMHPQQVTEEKNEGE